MASEVCGRALWPGLAGAAGWPAHPLTCANLRGHADAYCYAIIGSTLYVAPWPSDDAPADDAPGHHDSGHP